MTDRAEMHIAALTVRVCDDLPPGVAALIPPSGGHSETEQDPQGWWARHSVVICDGQEGSQA